MVAAAILIVFTLPLLCVVALATRLQLGPGVIYRQQRVGKMGKTFTIYKFRTMQQDRRRAQSGVPSVERRKSHKREDDPRHTTFGRFLRNTSLDELPQLWNVLKGDMSLIGPRPELVSVCERYELRDHPRLTVKPGITGLWQVSPLRSGLLHEGLHLDVEYVNQVSFWTDLKILLRTVGSLVRRTGA